VWNLISFLVEIEKYKGNVKKIFQLLSRMKILFNPMKEPDKYGRLCIAAKLDSPVVQVVTTLKRLYWLEWK
jgi:hypothetical protein